MMIWKFDEEYINDIIESLSENISRLEKAKTLLERLTGSEVDSREALDILWEVSGLLNSVITDLEPISDRISEDAYKIEKHELGHRCKGH